MSGDTAGYERLLLLKDHFVSRLTGEILKSACPFMEKGPPPRRTTSVRRVASERTVPDPLSEEAGGTTSIGKLREELAKIVDSLLAEIDGNVPPLAEVDLQAVKDNLKTALIKRGYRRAAESGVEDLLISDSAPESINQYRSIRRFLKEAGSATIRSTKFLSGEPGEEGTIIFEEGSPLAATVELLNKVAASDINVLLTGETGAGKELLAREIHKRSPRRDGPFVIVNMATIPVELAESEMFGHERGAFTGALFRRIGRFEEAHGGTLLLDEIGEIDERLQAKLLQFLQERKFTRVGSNTIISPDVRIIAATNRDLEELVRQGRFREDLYYRICVFPIKLPPLRERPDDIPPLAHHFMKVYSRRCDKSVEKISFQAMKALMDHDFPGNVRELENIIARAVILADGDTIRREHILFGSQAYAYNIASMQIAEYFDRSIDDIVRRLLGGEFPGLSDMESRRIASFLKEKKTSLTQLFAAQKTNIIRNADYRRHFSCSSITARRHLKMLSQCGLLRENETGHRGRGAKYEILAPTELWGPSPGGR